MDFKKLADLLYPNLTHTAKCYEELYPKRDLPLGAEVTRFAPSPTGYLHMGGFYQALVDSRIASNTGGVFYFRLEDTDKKREIQGAGDIALNILKEYGLLPMEGLMPDGNQVGQYGPYVQSERLDIYKAFAYELVAKGRAFPCFCDKSEGKEDIEERREKMLKEQDTIIEHDPCRDLTYEQIEANIKAKKPWALRLRSLNNEDDKIIVNDAVLGDREIPANTKDLVLIKSNGIPPYAFAHAVDDHLMRTTLVVRGGEWFPSVAGHIEIFEALGFDRVRYAHTGLISKLDGDNKRKLSKRKDPEADMRYFIQNGYPAEAVIDYILNLANSNYELWRKENPTASYTEFKFNIEKLNLSDPIFDIVKLEDISKNIISRLTTEEVFGMLSKWASEYDKEFYDIIVKRPDYIKGMIAIDRGGEKPRKDIAKMNEVYDYFKYMFDSDFECVFDEKFTKDDINIALTKYIEYYNPEDTKDEWFPRLKEACVSAGFCADMKEYKKNPSAYLGSVADYSTIIRIAVTGKRNTPDLCPIMKLLGYDKVIARLKRNIK